MDYFEPKIPDMLRRQMNSGSLSHAYILSGPPGSGTKPTAELLAAAIVCRKDTGKPCGLCRDCRKALTGIHPDIRTVAPEKDKTGITVGQIREMRADAAVVPNEAEKKVYLIEADGMNGSAQNAMLKILEEPFSHAAFILTAENPASLLPTVRSRCIAVGLLPPCAEDDGEGDETAAGFMDLLAKDDRFGLAALLFSCERMDKNDFSALCRRIRRLAADMLRGHYEGKASPVPRETLVCVIRVFEDAGRYMDFNVGTGHITGLVLSELL